MPRSGRRRTRWADRLGAGAGTPSGICHRIVRFGAFRYNPHRPGRRGAVLPARDRTSVLRDRRGAPHPRTSPQQTARPHRATRASARPSSSLHSAQMGLWPLQPRGGKSRTRQSSIPAQRSDRPGSFSYRTRHQPCQAKGATCGLRAAKTGTDNRRLASRSPSRYPLGRARKFRKSEFRLSKCRNARCKPTRKRLGSTPCGYSTMVVQQPSKLNTRVRFPLPAPPFRPRQRNTPLLKWSTAPA